MARRGQLPAYVAVGRITAPHGHRGMVRVEPYTDHPERFRSLDTVTAVRGNARHALTVQEVKDRGRMLVVKFAEINSLAEAEAWRGSTLEIPREKAYPLPPGHFYFFELVDLPVYSEEGDFLGYVEEVLRTGSNDVWVVRHPEGGREILLPAIREVVKAVDLEREEIRVRLLPGLGE